MTNKYQGFSLIELMIVVAIIAILAAIAIPLYLNYTARAQGSEGLELAGSVKTNVVEFYNTHYRWPNGSPANASVGSSNPTAISGKYVTQVEVQGGRIVATFGNQVNVALSGKTLTLSPITHAGAIEWMCKTTAPFRLVPSNCRNPG